MADRLLALLSTDDTFRNRFEHNPHVALSEVGFSPPEGEAWPGCFFGIRLASKEQIAMARSEIRNMLMGGLGQIPPQLDADLHDRRRVE